MSRKKAAVPEIQPPTADDLAYYLRSARDDLDRLVALWTYVAGDTVGTGADAAREHQEAFAKSAANVALSLAALREALAE